MHIRHMHGRQGSRQQHCAELEQPLQLAMHIMAFCGHTHGHVRIDIAIACTTLTCCSSFKVSVSTAAALLCCCTCAAVLTCAARHLQGTAPQHHSTTAPQHHISCSSSTYAHVQQHSRACAAVYACYVCRKTEETVRCAHRSIGY